MRERVKRILRMAISLVCLLSVCFIVDFNEVIRLTKGIKVVVLLQALALMLFGHICNGLRFRYILKCLGRRLDVKDAIKVTFVSLWFNQLLPTGMAGDVVRVVMLSKQCGRVRIVLSALLDRLAGLLWMMAIVLIFLPIAMADRLDQKTIMIFMGVFSICLLIGLAPVLMSGSACNKDKSRIITKACRYFGLMGTAMRRVLTPATFARLALLLSLTFLPYVLYIALIGNSFGMKITLLEYIALVPVIFITMQIPISIGGWGVRELSFLYLFPYVGMTEEMAVVISVLYGTGLLITSIPGNLFWVFSKPAAHRVPS